MFISLKKNIFRFFSFSMFTGLWYGIFIHDLLSYSYRILTSNAYSFPYFLTHTHTHANTWREIFYFCNKNSEVERRRVLLQKLMRKNRKMEKNEYNLYATKITGRKTKIEKIYFFIYLFTLPLHEINNSNNNNNTNNNNFKL